MMAFTESNTVELMIIDLLSGRIDPAVNAPLTSAPAARLVCHGGS